MKRAGIIWMAVSILLTLLGCSGRKAEPWQSLTYHVTSSVLAEGCHFSLSREGEQLMLSGYCYDTDAQYSREEPGPISRETATAITGMLLEQASSERKKLFSMADGRQVTVTLGYADGSERRISLSPDQREELLQLLRKELIQK